MLLTPTYHVFDLYQGHQGATLLPTQVDAPDYSSRGVKVPSLSVSASRAPDGDVTLSVVNLDPASQRKDLEIDIDGGGIRTASGRVITAEADGREPRLRQGRSTGAGSSSGTWPYVAVPSHWWRPRSRWSCCKLRLLPQPRGGAKKPAE